MSREQQLAQVFVELADTLVTDFDLTDFLLSLTERCGELMGVDAVGILLTDQQGNLQLVAASTAQAKQLELFQLQSEQGPCLDCFATGEPVVCGDLAAYPQRWPIFTAAAAEVGFVAVHALPMRLREDVIGALNLFSTATGTLDVGTAALCQAFADVATIGILSERAAREKDLLSQQLHLALNTRIIIEQAKGILAERRGVPVDQAFITMRGWARSHNRKLAEVALAVVEDDHSVTELAHPHHSPERRRPGVPRPPARPAGSS